jgi:hypothetical protein
MDGLGSATTLDRKLLILNHSLSRVVTRPSYLVRRINSIGIDRHLTRAAGRTIVSRENGRPLCNNSSFS